MLVTCMKIFLIYDSLFRRKVTTLMLMEKLEIFAEQLLTFPGTTVDQISWVDTRRVQLPTEIADNAWEVRKIASARYGIDK